MTNLSSGAIAGVVIGVVIFLILVIYGIIKLSHNQSAKRHEQSLHLQRERNANKTVRDRAGTLIHAEEAQNGTENGAGKPKVGGTIIGQSYYHETDGTELEKRI